MADENLKDSSTDDNSVQGSDLDRIEYRRTLMELAIEQARIIDKQVLALSTAAIALSLLFTREISEDGGLKCVTLVFSSWILFVCAILSTLLSFLFGRKSCIRQIETMDDAYSRGEDWIQQLLESSNPYAILTEVSNTSAIVCFVAGVIVFLLFAIENVQALM